MKSALDTHSYEAGQFLKEPETPEKPVIIPGKHSRATKIKDLSSDVLGTGNTIQKYNDI